jgi:hypothetical protein
MSFRLHRTLHGLLACLVAAACACVTACSSSSSGSAALTSGCQPLASLSCASGDQGYVCAPGSAPGLLACQPPTVDGNGNDDFCCYAPDGGAPCAPSAAVTATCSESGESGYQCDNGSDPASTDSTLSCDEGQPAPDAVHTNFCCAPKVDSSDAGVDVAAPTPEAAPPAGDGAATGD